MEVKESEYIGYDGTQLFMRFWEPAQPPRAVILGVHGLGSHSGLISSVGEFFGEEGFLFYAPDMRGFGRNPEPRGHVESFDEYVKDLDSLVSFIKLRHPENKLFLFGHSLGGLWVLNYALAHQHEIDGLIAACPGVSERLKISGATKAIAKMLSVANVKKYFDNGIDLNLIAKNPEVIRRNKEDPLRFDKATPRFAVEGFNTRERVFDSAGQIKVPIFIPQAANDLLVDPVQNKDFFDRLGSEDKTWKLYEGLYHEPFEDEGGEEMLKDMVSWLNARI